MCIRDRLGADAVTPYLDEALPDLDVVYMLRIQMERLESAPFPSLREYNLLYGLTRERERLMKEDAIICHPEMCIRDRYMRPKDTLGNGQLSEHGQERNRS